MFLYAEVRQKQTTLWAAFAEASVHDKRAQPYRDMIAAVDALPAPKQNGSWPTRLSIKILVYDTIRVMHT